MMCGRAVERVPDLAHEPAAHGWRWLPHSLHGDRETDRASAPRPILVLPYGFDTNDMKFFQPNRFVRPEDFSGYVLAALDTLLDEAARRRSSMLTVGFHLRICGRPARFSAVGAILSRLQILGDRVWMAPRRAIAEAFVAAQGL